MMKLRLFGFAILATNAFLYGQSMGQEMSPGNVKQTIVLSEIGDAQCEMELQLPTRAYTKLKTENPNSAVFLRRLGWEHVPQDIKKNEVQFEDATSTIRVRWSTLGLASLRGGRWIAPLAEISRGYLALTETNRWENPLSPEPRIQLLRVNDNEILLTESVSHIDENSVKKSHPMAQMATAATAVTQIKSARPFGKVQIEQNPQRIVFESSPIPSCAVEKCAGPVDAKSQQVSETTGVRASQTGELKVEARVIPHLMSSIAKSYGTEVASTFWVAKLTAHNSGSTAMRNYKVRFQLSASENMDWTPWESFDAILPNQTIVVPFHPLMDPHLFARNDSTQRAFVRIEYSYLDSVGQRISERLDRKIEILGRNEVLWSSFTNNAKLDFKDHFNNAPLVLASLTTKDDPVVQMVAGRIAGMAGSVSASKDNKCAIVYLEAIHRFMAANISYQTPPGALFDHNSAQHVKYARDVFRNRAGTCVDLAITYASLCEAVGLNPVLVIKPEHCFPAIILPECGTLLPLESTCLTATFEEARKRGSEHLKDCSAPNSAYFVNIRHLRNRGVHPLDLPTASESVLDSWHLTFPPAKVVAKPNETQGTNRDAPQSPLFQKQNGLSSTSGTEKLGQESYSATQLAQIMKQIKKSEHDHSQELESIRTKNQQLERELASTNDRMKKLSQPGVTVSEPTKTASLRSDPRSQATSAPRINRMESVINRATGESAMNSGRSLSNLSNVNNGNIVNSMNNLSNVNNVNNVNNVSNQIRNQVNSHRAFQQTNNGQSVVMNGNGMRISQPNGTTLIMDQNGIRFINE